jgi:hypothetical protein
MVTRVYGKLVGEFIEALYRVVVGAEVLVNDRFKKPDDLVGPYFIVAAAGASFGYRSAERDRDLVAVDLSTSGIRTLSGSVFSGCTRLTAVAFPPELESIGNFCFCGCDALHVIDLGATQVKTLDWSAFSECGVTQLSIPASLRQMGWEVFQSTPLKSLDLSACGDISVDTPSAIRWWSCRFHVKASRQLRKRSFCFLTWVSGDSSGCALSRRMWESTSGTFLSSPRWWS